MAPPKRPWFRFYTEAVHDKKLRRQKPETRWLFVACLAAARQSPTPGWLMVSVDVPMDWDDLADFASLSRRQVRDGMVALSAVKVVEYDTEIGCWYVPAWGSRQYESDLSTPRGKAKTGPDTTAYQRRINGDTTAYQRRINGDTPHDATAPETETETETEPPYVPPVPNLAADQPGGGDLFDRATALVVAEETARRIADGWRPRSKEGYMRSRMAPVRSEHENEWRSLLERTPTLTAQQLASYALGDIKPTPLDATLAAQMARMTSTPCEVCGTTNGMGFNEETGLAGPCPVCRPDDHRLDAA